MDTEVDTTGAYSEKSVEAEWLEVVVQISPYFDSFYLMNENQNIDAYTRKMKLVRKPNNDLSNLMRQLRTSIKPKE
ncbi:hypothetical protein OAF74_03825 [bacterium]|jgi:hypothetical protein|nr:hypothetical protein [bacterium]MDB4731948.1 hypothetical protein [bacterium]